MTDSSSILIAATVPPALATPSIDGFRTLIAASVASTAPCCGRYVHRKATPARASFQPRKTHRPRHLCHTPLQTYTNLGIDDRNQFDLTRSLPGGVLALREVVHQLHARGVRALWAYNPCTCRRSHATSRCASVCVLRVLTSFSFCCLTQGIDLRPDRRTRAAQTRRHLRP